MSERFARVWYEDRVWSCRVGDGEIQLIDGDWIEGARRSHGRPVPASEVHWLAPTEPRTILCVGRNYYAHAAEMHNEVPTQPLFFLKQRGALTGHHSPVLRPSWVGRVDFEGELVLVMGKTLRNCQTSREALEAVAGLTVGNDVTARELQKTDGQWTRAKGFDTFAPVGPWVLVDQHPEGRRITTRVNGELRQDSSTDQLIFGCDRLIMDASRFMTLHPGDMIFTGTPAGVGPVEDGDTVEISVQDVGTLSNSIKNGD